jgi:signal peptidase I
VGIPVRVFSDSMTPNYKLGEWVFTKQPFLVGLSDVVFYYAIIDGRPVIMLGRVIALPGQTITLEENKIIIDGKVLDQSRVIKKGTVTSGAEFLRENTPYKVPYGEAIIMGDNRENSIDSRNFGPVPRSAIIGKVAFK